MMKKSPLLSVLIILIFSFKTTGQDEKVSSFISDSLDRYMENAIQDWQVPGAAVAIVKGGRLIYLKGFGYLRQGSPEKVNENTLFMIGSNTKAFTGTAMAFLDYEGRCSLDDKVQKWLPDFTMKDLWVASEINLTDILCHRIGMESFQGDFMYWTSDLTLDQVIVKFGELTPMYGFRSHYGYTNAGFAIAGKCIENISGTPWHAYIQQKFLDPLEMKRTLTLSKEMASANNAAKPYTMVDGHLIEIPYPKIDNLAPAGSISSSVADMSHWVICLLDSGNYNGKQVIPREVIIRTRQPESILRSLSSVDVSGHFVLYGLGWRLQDYYGRELVYHAGEVNGFCTSVTLVPEEKTGIVVLTNSDSNELYSSARWDILNLLLGIPFKNVNAMSLIAHKKRTEDLRKWISEKRDSVAMHPEPEIPLSNYAGHYINEAYGYINIRPGIDKLIMSFQHHPSLSGTLEYIGNNRFLCTYNDPEFGIKVIPFVTDGEKVRSFTLHVADFVELTPYEFRKRYY